jgi:hypothetical protein
MEKRKRMRQLVFFIKKKMRAKSNEGLAMGKLFRFYYDKLPHLPQQVLAKC